MIFSQERSHTKRNEIAGGGKHGIERPSDVGD